MIKLDDDCYKVAFWLLSRYDWDNEFFDLKWGDVKVLADALLGDDEGAKSRVSRTINAFFSGHGKNAILGNAWHCKYKIEPCTVPDYVSAIVHIFKFFGVSSPKFENSLLELRLGSDFISGKMTPHYLVCDSYDYFNTRLEDGNHQSAFDARFFDLDIDKL